MSLRPLDEDEWRVAAEWRAVGVILRDLFILLAVVVTAIMFFRGVF